MLLLLASSSCAKVGSRGRGQRRKEENIERAALEKRRMRTLMVYFVSFMTEVN